MFFQIIQVGKEDIGLVWSDENGEPLVETIYLPGKEKMADRIFRDYPVINRTPRKVSGSIDQEIAGLYRGEKRSFNLSLLNWSKLTDFSAKVLKQAYRIPRGKVSTYSGLAKKTGSPRAARATGTALANNPFPIVIPCHRVIRADGSTGKFGGGSDMKKQLLRKEGVIPDEQGNIPRKYIRN